MNYSFLQMVGGGEVKKLTFFVMSKIADPELNMTEFKNFRRINGY